MPSGSILSYLWLYIVESIQFVVALFWVCGLVERNLVLVAHDGEAGTERRRATNIFFVIVVYKELPVCGSALACQCCLHIGNIVLVGLSQFNTLTSAQVFGGPKNWTMLQKMGWWTIWH